MAKQAQGNRAILIGALACGVVAAVLAFMFLAQQDEEPEDVGTATLVVARRDIPAYTALDPQEDLEELEVPGNLGDLISRSITPDYLDKLEGRQINRVILSGTPLMYADLVSTAEMMIAEDHFALSLSVDGAHAVSGLLVPGDYVKVLVTRPLEEQQEQAPATAATTPEAMIAQAITQSGTGQSPTLWKTSLVSNEKFKVLAVDRQISASPRQYEMMFPQEDIEDRSYTTVTLEVSEDQAIAVLSESGAGELPVTLLLCPRPTPSGVAGGDF